MLNVKFIDLVHSISKTACVGIDILKGYYTIQMGSFI